MDKKNNFKLESDLEKVEVIFKINGEGLIVQEELNDEFKSYLEENLGPYKIMELASAYLSDTQNRKIDEFYLKNKLKWSYETIECINKFFEDNIDIDYSLDYFTFGECDNNSVTIIANVSGDLFLKKEKSNFSFLSYPKGVKEKRTLGVLYNPFFDGCVYIPLLSVITLWSIIL